MLHYNIQPQFHRAIYKWRFLQIEPEKHLHNHIFISGSAGEPLTEMLSKNKKKKYSRRHRRG
uniref:Uncharacterized protein n=1 Tax=Arundo donax TaxID=35708 RepID=A0A0A9CDM2_ARUDO